jgi:hypothetical protein
MKKEWFAAREQAQKLVTTLPPDEVGCLYLGGDHKPLTPEPASTAFPSLTRHRGCIRGAWPTVFPG